VETAQVDLTETPAPAVLDTDIGTDVDDALALVLLARSPELRLVGVTTVYGDTLLRARIARYLLDQLGLPDIPVIVGAAETLTKRPVWWPGHEGVGLPELPQVQPPDVAEAVGYLCRTAREYAGTLRLFAIGPLTNVAAALRVDPAFATNLRHLTVMGGVFWQDRAEHNIRCDPEAAEIVMRSGVPMTVCGLDVTTKVWLGEPEVTALATSGDSLGPILADQVRRWWVASGRTADNPHDALAVLSAIRPDLFRFEQCAVHVELEEPRLAWTLPADCDRGDIAIAAEVAAEEAQTEIMRRLTRRPV
jgi:purine nucleosidase